MNQSEQKIRFLKKLEETINKGQFDKARSLLRDGPELDESMKLAVHGALAFKEERFQEAEVLLTNSIGLNKKNGIAVANLAQLYLRQQDLKRAKPIAELVYQSNPTNENWGFIYAQCLMDEDKVEAAWQILEKFVSEPKPTERMIIQAASISRALLRIDQSESLLRRAKELYPDSDSVDKAMCDIFSEVAPEKTRNLYKNLRWDTIKEEKKKAYLWNWSFTELRLRDFKLGWELYENGLDPKIGKVGRPLPPQTNHYPLKTQLETLDLEKNTYYVAEQGLGDQVLFLSSFNSLEERYKKNAILVTEDRMQPILKRAFPDTEIINFGNLRLIENFKNRTNGCFPIGSLMKYYRKSEEDFISNRRPYLYPDKTNVEKLRGMLKEKTPDKPIIGISWAGGYWDRQKKTKSIDFLSFANLSKRIDAKMLCLQYGDTEKERRFAQQHQLPIIFTKGINFKTQLDEWFALICACDVILSVSTAAVHFAGAAGKRTHVLLREYMGPFIWGTADEEHSIAYPNLYTHRQLKTETELEFLTRIIKKGI
jgi:ADP-heptose:LPS heptosyltransferase